MVQILAAFTLIALIPFMLKDFRRSLARNYLVKDLVPSLEKMDGLGERTGIRYCWFELPATNIRLLAEISIEKFEALKNVSQKASIVVRKMPFMRPVISHVQWDGEEAYEPAEKGFGAAYAAFLYFLAGLGFLMWTFEFVGMEQQVGFYLSALLLAMSGYMAMAYRASDFEPSDLASAPVRMLGIPIGKGKVGYTLAALICFGGTIFLFSTVSFLTILLGLNLAVSLGCLVYLAEKS